MKVFLVFHQSWIEDEATVKKVFYNYTNAVTWLDLYLDNSKGIH